MSDRPTPETDAIECKVVFWQMTEHAKKLERQRDIAVEALKLIGEVKVPRGLKPFEYVCAVLREIEGKS